MPYAIGKNKGQLRADDIQQDEIQVFQPALFCSLVHLFTQGAAADDRPVPFFPQKTKHLKRRCCAIGDPATAWFALSCYDRQMRKLPANPASASFRSLISATAPPNASPALGPGIPGR
jgi:hypothetical protein